MMVSSFQCTIVGGSLDLLVLSIHSKLCSSVRHSVSPSASGEVELRYVNNGGFHISSHVLLLLLSFTSLSFTSQISPRPNCLIFSRSKSLSISLAPKPTTLTISASVASPPELETMDLKKLVKSRLPGGFAAS
ncbi:30S ribosomal protein S9 [Tripterygium wilfordii]|uniref:30S ribosomal protein S9 n=1 Tax=Tripterygium wilfordii TaxID=458696 RepID=A0A7J7D333_TRIWF|nr:30S ribosomal protein S9 [Tripterygium wilfordii]